MVSWTLNSIPSISFGSWRNEIDFYCHCISIKGQSPPNDDHWRYSLVSIKTMTSSVWIWGSWTCININIPPTVHVALQTFRNAIHRDFKLSEKLGSAYETPRILAALTMHHAVCELLGSKSRNQVVGMHVEATFRNRIAEAVSDYLKSVMAGN